jgi:hypothetical protein
MSQPTILLACPKCKETCRTRRETRPGATMRCPGCHGVFRFFVHGNGAVELRPVDDDDEPAPESRLPARVADQDETQGTRKILTSRRLNRPMGGHKPNEKPRIYIGAFALWIVLGLGSLAGYVYFDFLNTANKQMGKTAYKGINWDIEAKRKEHQKKQQDALKKLEKLKKQPTNVQPAGAKVEDGRLPGDQDHD